MGVGVVRIFKLPVRGFLIFHPERGGRRLEGGRVPFERGGGDESVHKVEQN